MRALRAVRATLRKEVEAGGWGPFLVSVESTSPNARFRVSFWNAEHQDLGAFAVHDPVLMSCVLMCGVTGGRGHGNVRWAAAIHAARTLHNLLVDELRRLVPPPGSALYYRRVGCALFICLSTS